MQYFFVGFVIVGVCIYVWNMFFYQKEKIKEPEDTHTEEQKKYYKGEDKPSIDFHGRLINMDEHTQDLFEK